MPSYVGRYNSGLYGQAGVLGAPYPVEKSLTVNTVARIVRARPDTVPPVIDTWYKALAQRFDYLQMAIQTFGLMNKIQYSKGTDLDNIWGKIYDLPRMTNESDDDYRARLQTYTSALVGCGSRSMTLEVLNFLAGSKEGVTVDVVWPAKVIISSDNIQVLRNIKSRIPVFMEVVPKLLASGVDWEILLPYLDYQIVAYVAGDRILPIRTLAAVQDDQSCDISTIAAVAIDRSHDSYIAAALQAERAVTSAHKAAIIAERVQSIGAKTAIMIENSEKVFMASSICAERYNNILSAAAITMDRQLTTISCTAISKTFEQHCNHVAWIVGAGHLDCYTIAAIRGDAPFQTVKMRARIAKPKGDEP